MPAEGGSWLSKLKSFANFSPFTSSKKKPSPPKRTHTDAFEIEPETRPTSGAEQRREDAAESKVQRVNQPPANGFSLSLSDRVAGLKENYRFARSGGNEEAIQHAAPLANGTQDAHASNGNEAVWTGQASSSPRPAWRTALAERHQPHRQTPSANPKPPSFFPDASSPPKRDAAADARPQTLAATTRTPGSGGGIIRRGLTPSIGSWRRPPASAAVTPPPHVGAAAPESAATRDDPLRTILTLNEYQQQIIRPEVRQALVYECLSCDGLHHIALISLAFPSLPIQAPSQLRPYVARVEASVDLSESTGAEEQDRARKVCANINQVRELHCSSVLFTRVLTAPIQCIHPPFDVTPGGFGGGRAHPRGTGADAQRDRDPRAARGRTTLVLRPAGRAASSGRPCLCGNLVARGELRQAGNRLNLFLSDSSLYLT